MMEKKQRLQEFEALRGLSILLLLVLHSEVLGLMVFGVELGPSGVFVASLLLGSFFFLAGYFTDVTLQKPYSNVLGFLRSKFIRIFPPYWLGLALFILVLGYSLNRFAFAVYVLNLQAIFSPNYVKQVLTLWYISMLVVYYIFFIVLLLRVKSNRMLLIWAGIVFAVAYVAHLIYGLFDPRFFQYYFIFLAGVYFSRFEEFRNWMFDTNFLYKVIVAILGVWIFWLAQSAGYGIVNGWYLLTADLFILGWVWMLLAIFRTRLGGGRIWAFLSTASFFAYLIHRPVWHILASALALDPGQVLVLTNLIPGSIIVLIMSYFLQRGYDRLLSVFRLK